MSQTAAPFIHTGPWVNWSRGRVLGSTITLSERDGDLFIAFLGIFVTVVGAACWKIMSFAMHQLRSPPDAQDGIHHQQQAILRNTGSPFQASYELAQLSWSWRKHALRPFVRTLPLVALALFNFALFANADSQVRAGVAGIFSSEVAKAAGNETLIRSPDCGFLNFTEDTVGGPQGLAALTSVEVNDTLAATTYSRACYGNSQTPLQCTQYPQSQLHWKVNQNATCPFSDDLCVYGDLSAYEMDTGLIDSHHALGINAPKSERVQYRQVTTCSPIHTRGYITELNDTDSSQPTYGALLQQINYGPTSEFNYTYQYNTISLTESIGYTLKSYVYHGGQDDNNWYPVDALNRTDADVSLFLLAQNNVQYEAPSLDPFYAASTPLNLTADDGKNVTFYLPNQNQRITALACTDQHQYCNPTNKQCTTLNSLNLTHTSLYSNAIGLNDAQMTTLRQIDFIAHFLTTYNSVASRGDNALRASETVDGLIQYALPANQWMTEVSSWFAVSMAKLQQKVIQYATGPGYVPPGMTLTRPLSRQESRMCMNQIVRSSSIGTTSFSVLGVAIILIIGTVLIPTSLLLPSALALLRRLFKRKQYKDLQWAVDGKLQLQRMAFEESGQGRWSGGADSVPVTRIGELLGLPEGVDRKHPRLGRRGSGSESGSGMLESENLIGDDDKDVRVKAHAMVA